MAKKNLVIVESPAKAKTIEKYLGPDFVVKASFGHVRDLPPYTLGVDIEKEFEPSYKTIKGKSKLLTELKAAGKGKETIWLATDPDREGEAIAWHVQVGAEYPEEKVKRIVFNEITKKAIQAAIKTPRELDMQLINAQQARRVLDRLIGYRVSPILSKKIKKGSSAGRVQSVALKLVCERERAILAFIPEEYWVISARVKDDKSASFDIKLFAENDPKTKILVTNEAQATQVTDEIKAADLVIDKVTKRKQNRHPQPPFITSTLQQEASRKLNWTAKKTMMIAQQLYEGVEVDGEAVGLITYMRTDSVRVSKDAQSDALSYVKGKYGQKYLPESPRVYKMKKNSQDAHEAIRPSLVDYTPDAVQGKLSADQLKLYQLIWKRFVASQMVSAELENTQILVKADKYYLKATGHVVVFEGFMALYMESKDDEDAEEAEGTLPKVEEGAALTAKSIEKDQKFTQPPNRYTEATLVKILEEKGIGRPSTYAPTISTILDRGYVEREKKTLFPTELGMVIDDQLGKFFESILNYNFTAEMENDLDEISEGKHNWFDIVAKFYKPLMADLEVAKEKMEKINRDKPTDEVCDKCDHPMVIKDGRYGEFMACSNFPECKNTKAITKPLEVACPKCKSELQERRTRKGKIFYGCSGYPKCDYAAWNKPVKDDCPKCKAKYLLEKGGRSPKIYCETEGCDYSKDTE
ncbi:type I DNA topoisomerase [bacterium]|jgi:DNA topoisomerase I|nr:type I DNA topoisomerase [bacterium]